MKINIAVCDDEHRYAEYIRILVNKWANENDIKIKIDMFESAENFKSAWNKNKIYDILLLDIQMGGQNGVELAKELRGTDSKLIIIFITALPDFVNDGYDVFALHYLMKPVNETKLCEVLNRAAKSISKTATAIFVPVGGEQLRISISDIMYIGSLAHFLEVATTKGTFTVKMPIYELEQQIGDSFARCHRSYIVGLRHVDKITKTDVILDDGSAIPLSRRLYDEVNRALILYFMGEES
ncbi:MAG: LytTR family DNA-binding domain-containing protein [Oscillospiraceae bacterium]|nr:LytTR family DNA-binding domain-containing protein [Oscillospiraceae bacterium]